MHSVAFFGGRTDEGRDDSRLVVAVANDFSFVQTKSRRSLNPAPSAVSGVEVVWRIGHGLPEARGKGAPLPVFDAVGGHTLQAEAIPDGYNVSLPESNLLFSSERRGLPRLCCFGRKEQHWLELAWVCSRVGERGL
jgi:hypothetical protein